MSLKTQIRRAVSRSGLAVGDFQALQREVHALVALVESNVAIVGDLQARLSALAGIDLRHEIDSLATAHAEAMVYLNRSLREIRSETLAISAALGRIESASFTGQHE